ncbi:hypothetical protein BD413DRAFT_506874 [Trametes elegans]|nr:hypothetical protein BD413DRAFT_506874 [Trametes elegans]
MLQLLLSLSPVTASMTHKLPDAPLWDLPSPSDVIYTVSTWIHRIQSRQIYRHLVCSTTNCSRRVRTRGASAYHPCVSIGVQTAPGGLLALLSESALWLHRSFARGDVSGHRHRTLATRSWPNWLPNAYENHAVTQSAPGAVFRPVG